MTAGAFTIADTAGPRIPLSGGTNGYRMVTKTITCDGGTATDVGDVLAPIVGSETQAQANARAMGLSSIVWLHADAVAAGHFHTYDYTNHKLQTWKSTGSAGAFAAMTGAISHVIKVTAIGAP